MPMEWNIIDSYLNSWKSIKISAETNTLSNFIGILSIHSALSVTAITECVFCFSVCPFDALVRNTSTKNYAYSVHCAAYWSSNMFILFVISRCDNFFPYVSLWMRSLSYHGSRRKFACISEFSFYSPKSNRHS